MKLQLSGVCFFFFCFFKPAMALAKGQIFLHPIEIIGYKGASLQLKVEVPCGGKYLGIVAREQPRRELQLGAAIYQGGIMCAGLGQKIDLTVDYLNVFRFHSIESVPFGLPHKVNLTAIEELKVRRSDVQGAEELVGSSMGGCEPTAGVLIRSLSNKSIRLDFLHFSRRGITNKGSKFGGFCRDGVRYKVIRSLSQDAIRRVLLMSGDPSGFLSQSLHRKYELRFAKVDLSKSINNTEGLLYFRRTCRDVPIGVVSKIKKSSVNQGLSLGILVAHYFNGPCPVDESADHSVWDSLSLNQYGIGWPLSIAEVVDVLGENEIIKVKNIIDIDVVQEARYLEIIHGSACFEDDIYLIYGATSAGLPSLGLIQRMHGKYAMRSLSNSKKCNEDPKLFSIFIPKRLSKIPVPMVLPRS